MLLGIVSDTHGQVDSTRQAIRILESLDVNLVIHCGDIGSAATIALFAAWPTHFVFGNCDNRIVLGEAIDQAGQTSHGRFGKLQLEGRRIAFLHGDKEGLFRKTVASGRWDLVCYGHTHLAETSTVGRTRVLNPGALSRAGQRSVATVQLPSLEVTPIML